jgi:cell division protein FtsW (lipid II flippase)
LSAAISPELSETLERRETRLFRLGFVFLLLTAVALALSPAARAEDWSLALRRWQPLVVVPVWAAGVWLVGRVVRRTRRPRDPFLLPTAFLLTGWGILAVWRVAPEFGARQTVWFIVSVVALAEILPRPGILRWLRRYRYLLLTAGIALAALTLIFGTNPAGGETRLWLGCCGLYFQPSEPLRLLLLAYFASFLADRMALSPRQAMAPPLATLAPLVVLWGLSVALLAVQRDLGTGTLFLALLAFLLYFASGQARVLVGAALMAGVGGVLGYLAFDIVRVRVNAWISPWADPAGASYQIVQSMIAMASGGLFGRGPGLGSPGFVPVAHTDFIFAAVTEEWGLAGGLAMIALFAVLVSRGLRAAVRSRDRFSSLLAAGISLAFGLQAIIILGGVLRLLPLTGVTLPFVSYGGSSLVTSFIGIGLLVLLSSEASSSSAFRKPIVTIHSWLLLAWMALALSLGWWTLVRAPILTARTDNPRRGVSELYSLRGAIVDRAGDPLALSTGDRGDYVRSYPEPSAFSVVGFDSFRYGQAGVEGAMDAALRGEAGQDPWLIWWHHLLTGTPPPGMDIRLSLDLQLQRAAAQELEGRMGAIVAMDTSTGEVYAMASSPTYDPNRIDEDWTSLVNRADAPLLNRATQGRYQPGGALSPFVTAWAMREDIARLDDPTSSLHLPLTFSGRSLSCAQTPPGSTPSTLRNALIYGCPLPIADLGAEIGAEGVSAMLRAFGLDEFPGLGLHEESAYHLPQGEDARLAAAGQGTLTVSPVQVARAFAAITGDGFLPPLRLIMAERVPGSSWLPLPGGEPASAAISRDEADAILESLPVLDAGSRGLAVRAAVGGLGDYVTWFLGYRVGVVVVVALEGGSPEDAQRAGLAVLMAWDGLP